VKKELELSDQKSCLNKAHDDEPVFVLRANDELAPGLVRQWANAYLANKIMGQLHGPVSHRVYEKYREAQDIANDMESWKKVNGNAT
jgi:hypothetical protein